MNSSQLPPRPLSSTLLTCKSLTTGSGSATIEKVAELHDTTHSYRRRLRSAILDKVVEHELQHGAPVPGPDMDMKRLRKIISNRISSQKRRDKLAERSRQLLQQIEKYQKLIATLALQVQLCARRRKFLQMENEALLVEFQRQSSAMQLRESITKSMEQQIQLLKGGTQVPTWFARSDVNLTSPNEALSFHHQQCLERNVEPPGNETGQVRESNIGAYINWNELNLDGHINPFRNNC